MITNINGDVVLLLYYHYIVCSIVLLLLLILLLSLSLSLSLSVQLDNAIRSDFIEERKKRIYTRLKNLIEKNVTQRNKTYHDTKTQTIN